MQLEALLLVLVASRASRASFIGRLSVVVASCLKDINLKVILFAGVRRGSPLSHLAALFKCFGQEI